MIDIDKVFLFIGGLHRSGTSLLHRLIADHPQVSGFSETGATKDEGQYLQDVYRREAAFGGAGFFGFHSGSYLDESSPLVNEESAQKLFSEWSEHWELEKPILVEKTPANLVRGRFLQALFPETRFIMIVRHPIAVSYATKKWADLFRSLHHLTYRRIGQGIPPSKLKPYLPSVSSPIWLLIKHWVVCHEGLQNDRSHIENLLVVRYEDLTERPVSTLGKVWEFLDLEPCDPKREIKRGVNQKYFARWRKVRDQGGLGASLYSQYILSRFESKVGDFGYSLDI